MEKTTPTNYREYIRTVDDFPEKGVTFYDIAPLLGNGAIFGSLIEDMAAPLEGKVDQIIGFDARGFLFAGAMAARLGCGMSMLRKPGKLPGEIYEASYDLEYGRNTLTLQTNSIHPGERIALVDDVVATGGTALAGAELVRRAGGEIVEFCSVVDLPHLGGSHKLALSDIAVRSMVTIGDV